MITAECALYKALHTQVTGYQAVTSGGLAASARNLRGIGSPSALRPELPTTGGSRRTPLAPAKCLSRVAQTANDAPIGSTAGDLLVSKLVLHAVRLGVLHPGDPITIVIYLGRGLNQGEQSVDVLGFLLMRQPAAIMRLGFREAEGG